MSFMSLLTLLHTLESSQRSPNTADSSIPQSWLGDGRWYSRATMLVCLTGYWGTWGLGKCFTCSDVEEESKEYLVTCDNEVKIGGCD